MTNPFNPTYTPFLTPCANRLVLAEGWQVHIIHGSLTEAGAGEMTGNHVLRTDISVMRIAAAFAAIVIYMSGRRTV
jgi:hypothetical protein